VDGGVGEREVAIIEEMWMRVGGWLKNRGMDVIGGSSVDLGRAMTVFESRGGGLTRLD